LDKIAFIILKKNQNFCKKQENIKIFLKKYNTSLLILIRKFGESLFVMPWCTHLLQVTLLLLYFSSLKPFLWLLLGGLRGCFLVIGGSITSSKLIFLVVSTCFRPKLISSASRQTKWSFQCIQLIYYVLKNAFWWHDDA